MAASAAGAEGSGGTGTGGGGEGGHGVASGRERGGRTVTRRPRSAERCPHAVGMRRMRAADVCAIRRWPCAVRRPQHRGTVARAGQSPCDSPSALHRVRPTR